MKIRPLFKWFGSKWQSAKHYPVPEHDIICEPFAGGAGFSLVQTIHKKSTVVVCEAARKSDGKIPEYLQFVESHYSVTSRRKSTQSHHSKEVIYVRKSQLDT